MHFRASPRAGRIARRCDMARPPRRPARSVLTSLEQAAPAPSRPVRALIDGGATLLDVPARRRPDRPAKRCSKKKKKKKKTRTPREGCPPRSRDGAMFRRFDRKRAVRNLPLIVALISMLHVVSVRPADVSGVWSLRLLTSDGESAPRATVTLKQDAEKLTGTGAIDNTDQEFTVVGRATDNSSHGGVRARRHLKRPSRAPSIRQGGR